LQEHSIRKDSKAESMHAYGKQFALLSALCLSFSLEAVLPLRDQWRQACSYLASGRAVEALERFHEFDAWYGQEPEVADPDFREDWIRLWGLAAMQVGELGEAARLLERWLGENPDQQQYRAFIRFQLAGIYQSLGNAGQAAAHRSLFLEQHPNLPECALIRWNWADEAIANGDYETARGQLRQVIEIPSLPPSGQSLASAALALVELGQGSYDAALQHFSEASRHESPPLNFWRALAAPSLVQELLAADQPGPALEAAAWFGHPADLLHELADLRKTFREKSNAGAGTNVRQGIWNNHWQAQLDRLNWSLGQQAADGKVSNSLYPLRLRALIEADQPLRAIILGRAILNSSDSVGSDLRAESYKAIIEASLELNDWEQAELFAAQFLEHHPTDPALPDILFLNARTAAARKEWNAAIDQVEKLIEAFPDHKSRRSWRMLCADWRLQSGAAQTAMAMYLSLAAEAPDSWQAFLEFQQGRCHEALSAWEAAATRYQSVAANNSAPANLREFSMTSLLKLHLKRMQFAEFITALERYREKWPDGMNRSMVENLAGTFYQRMGETHLAISTFKAIKLGTGPEALFANEQLSVLYREINDMETLRAHALEWIKAALLEKSVNSDTPFLDCRIYQEKTSTAAIPESLFQSLVETLQAGTSATLSTPCLEVLRQHWWHYREWIMDRPAGIMEWVEFMATDARIKCNWSAFAALQLYAAHLLQQEGRHDSADTRRIEVLQVAGDQQLGDSTDFILSQTAHEYDFPNAEALLSQFLARYPNSVRQPQARLFTAHRFRLKGVGEMAKELVATVVQDWPDAAVFEEAALLLSQWSIEDGQPGRALPVLDSLLDTPGLPAATTAEALLLRAKVDFLSGATERGFLDCLRILSLYPDIHDAAQPAMALLSSQFKQLPEGDDRNRMRLKLQQSLAQDVLDKLQFNDA
jgi:tetratricopeptide (TPR) repeat protein